MKNRQQTNKVLQELVELLDIPPGYYEKAVNRYKSMADHFHRPQSTIRHLDPLVHPQGSFRLGTVIRPLNQEEGYDLDLVCRVLLSKDGCSQKDLKELIGAEVISYSQEQGFKNPPTEGKRCWTQEYQDEVSFHMDILPSIPAGEVYRSRLAQAGIEERLREEAINITDKTEPNYAEVDPDWPRSNPRGYARWFEARMDEGGVASRERKEVLGRRGDVYASAEEVPTYELKTPLQRAVQLLKRHRDQMFRADPKGKPISMILTTLAAHAYRGETDLAEAVAGILDQMDSFVSDHKPRVQNPVDPDEDFADKWERDPTLKPNFDQWLRQAREDFEAVGRVTTVSGLTNTVRGAFGLELSLDAAKASLVAIAGAPAVVGVTKVANDAPASWRP